MRTQVSIFESSQLEGSYVGDLLYINRRLASGHDGIIGNKFSLPPRKKRRQNISHNGLQDAEQRAIEESGSVKPETRSALQSPQIAALKEIAGHRASMGWGWGWVVDSLFLFFKVTILFIYLFLAVLGLCCCAWASFSCSEQGLLFVAVRRLLIVVASFVVEHRL